MGKIASAIRGLAEGIVSPVAKVFEKKEERKRLVAEADGKLAMAKANGETEVTLTDAEWEAKSIDANATSWKDEYLTVIITAPIIGLLVGGVYAGVTGDVRILDGVNLGLAALKETGVDMGELMYIVTLAGVGLKLWRSK